MYYHFKLNSIFFLSPIFFLPSTYSLNCWKFTYYLHWAKDDGFAWLCVAILVSLHGGWFLFILVIRGTDNCQWYPQFYYGLYSVSQHLHHPYSSFWPLLVFQPFWVPLDNWINVTLDLDFLIYFWISCF